MPGWTLFESDFGTLGLAWGGSGLIGVELPEENDSATRRRLHHRFPSLDEQAPPPEVQAAIIAVRRLLQGQPSDHLADLDLSRVTPFDARVYAATCEIPMGKVVTYGEMARALGDPLLSRAVGQSLGRNPWPVLVPCHRIVSSGGGKGGFSAFGGADTKMRLLRIEGAFAAEALPLFGGFETAS